MQNDMTLSTDGSLMPPHFEIYNNIGYMENENSTLYIPHLPLQSDYFPQWVENPEICENYHKLENNCDIQKIRLETANQSKFPLHRDIFKDGEKQPLFDENMGLGDTNYRINIDYDLWI